MMNFSSAATAPDSAASPAVMMSASGARRRLIILVSGREWPSPYQLARDVGAAFRRTRALEKILGRRVLHHPALVQAQPLVPHPPRLAELRGGPHDLAAPHPEPRHHRPPLPPRP